MIALTASRLPLLAECALPFSPNVATTDEPGTAALTGTEFHGFVQADIDGLPTPPPVVGADHDAAREMFEAWKRWWPSFRGTLWWHAEIPVAFDLVTRSGRFLPRGEHRDYSTASATEIPGTIDAVAFDPDARIVHVIDWKTGHPDYLDPADDSKQLAGLALAIAHTDGLDVRAVHVVIAHVAPDGVRLDRARLEAMDLDAAYEALQERVAAIENAKARPGNHCRFCPARIGCPETERSLASMVEETPASAIASVLRGEELTIEKIALASRALPMLEDLAKKARERLREHARKQGGFIPLGNGKALKLIPIKRENLSKDSINKALGDADAHVLLERLRKAGAITTSTSEQLREVKA